MFMTEVKEVTEDVLIQKIKKDNVFLFMAQDEFKTEEGISLRKQILKTSAIKLFEGKPDDSWLKISMGTLSEEEVAAYEKSFK